MRASNLILGLTLIILTTACGGGGGGVAPDTTAPTVETFYPDPVTDGDVSSADIQANGIKVIFDEGVVGTTVDATSFKVEEWVAGGTAVSGTVTYDGAVRTASFVPDSALNSSWDYVVTVTTAVTDIAGNNMAADYVVTIAVAPAAPPGGVP